MILTIALVIVTNASPAFGQTSKTCETKLVEAKRIAAVAIEEAQKANDDARKANDLAKDAQDERDAITVQRAKYREGRDLARQERDTQNGKNIALQERIIELTLKNDVLVAQTNSLNASLNSASKVRWVFFAVGVVGGAAATYAGFKVFQ
jgi:protein-disulfide isomerase-like protein with CxxC motif